VKSISLFRLQSVIISGHFLLGFGTASSFAISGLLRIQIGFYGYYVCDKRTLWTMQQQGAHEEQTQWW